MRFQVLFRQGTRVGHALERGRHDARRKGVAPDLNPLNYFAQLQPFSFQGHSLLSVAKGALYHLLLTEIQLQK